MGVGLSGVFSGMDTDTLIAQLMQVNARPLYQLDDRKAEWEAKQSAVADIESRLTTLKTLLADMRSADALRAVTPASSDNTILTVQADSSAGEGAHEVVVDRLAKSHKLVHTAGLAGLDSAVGAAKSTALNVNSVADADAVWFTTTANGATYTFDFGTESDIDNVDLAVSTGYSMNQVRDLINVRSQAVAGYDAASVEYDSQEGAYFLRLTADQADTEGTLTQTLTAGDAVDEIDDAADWSKTAAGEGRLQYTYDGTTRTLYVTDEATLEDLRDLINNDGSNPGVVASILEYGGTHHLVLAGRDTGSGYGVTVDNSETTLNGFDAGDFTETQAAQNARLRVDGYPADPNWMERSGNTVTDVIPGVTLNLRAAGTVSVTLNRNTGDLESKLANFAGVYNGLRDAVDGYTGYDEENETGGLMQGDSVLNGFVGAIRSVLTTPAAGFVDGEDTYVLAAQIGLTFDQYGEMSVVTTSTDTETSLSDALSSDYLSVLRLVGAMGDGLSDDSFIQFASAEADTEAGVYDVEIDFGAGGGIETARIRGEDEQAWQFLDVDGSTLLGSDYEDGPALDGLVLTAVSDGTPGAHTQTAEIRIRQGFAGSIYDYLDEILDATSGAVASKSDLIQDTIEDLDARIEVQEDRLETQEERLRAQFARLEGLLATYDRQLSAVEQLTNQVNSFANYLSNN